MVANHDAGTVDLHSDAIIAPHHGGNERNSTCFFEAGSPSAVVLSSGHQHRHPTTAALSPSDRSMPIIKTDTHYKGGLK